MKTRSEPGLCICSFEDHSGSGMKQDFYDYNREEKRLYSFISKGKTSIVKVVQFTPINNDIINLGFGDLLPDGGLNDKVVSDNGDMKKVFATVIRIVQEFTNEFPHMKIAFAGSTTGRMKLYNRILQTHYSDFYKEFTISGLIEDGLTVREVVFKPGTQRQYLAFFIKRKS